MFVCADQLRCFVSVDGSEPRLHVDAAAVFRVWSDDDVLIGRVALKHTHTPDQSLWGAACEHHQSHSRVFSLLAKNLTSLQICFNMLL